MVLGCTFLHQLTPCDRKLVLTNTTKAGVVNPSNGEKVTILNAPYSTVRMSEELAADNTRDENLVTLGKLRPALRLVYFSTLTLEKCTIERRVLHA